MKQIFIILISFICLFSCNYAEQKVVFSRYTDTAPVWTDVECALTLRDTCGGSNNLMTVKTMWSKDSLYLFFQVSDTNLQCLQTVNDHNRLFLDDMIEFLLDPRNDRGEQWIEDDIIYHINILGFKKDDRGTPEGKSDYKWNGCARYAINIYGTVNDTSDCDEGYDVEVAIPWNELGITPHSGLVMGADFVCGDNDCLGRQIFDWVGAKPFRHPIEFGDLILQ